MRWRGPESVGGFQFAVQPVPIDCWQRDRAKQSARVGVLGLRKNRGTASGLDDTPVLKHRDAIAERTDHR